MYASTSCSQSNEPRKSFAAKNKEKDDKKREKEKDQFGTDGDLQRSVFS